MILRTTKGAAMIGAFLIPMLSSCRKDEAADTGTEGATTTPEQTGGKVAHIVLTGDLVVVPGMKLRSKQSLKMSAGSFTTASGAGTSQGAMSIVDSEVRDIEFVSAREQILTLTEKQSRIVMNVGDAESTDETVRSELVGKKISAIQQKDGGWWYGLMEGDATGVQTRELQDMGEAEVLSVFAFPVEPVILGQEWVAGADALPSMLGASFRPDEARVHFRMNGVKTHEGQRCAELGVRVEAMGDYRIGEDQLPVKLVVDMKGTLLHSLNTFQDLKLDLEGILTLEHSPAAGTTIRADGNIEFLRENRIGG